MKLPVIIFKLPILTGKNSVLLDPIQGFIEIEAWLRQTFFMC